MREPKRPAGMTVLVDGNRVEAWGVTFDVDRVLSWTTNANGLEIVLVSGARIGFARRHDDFDRQGIGALEKVIEGLMLPRMLDRLG